MKYLIDFTALALLYAFVFSRKWKSQGCDILLVNTLLYIYLSFVLYFTLMPVITSLPFVLNHRYKPMNLAPFIDVSMGRGDFSRQVVLNTIMTIPFGFLFPLTRNRTAKLGRTVFFCFLMSLAIEIKIPTCTRGIETIGTSGTDLCILAIWDFEKPNLKFSQLFPAVPKVD